MLVAVLITLWFTGTVGLLLLIAWRARRQAEPPRVELLWEDPAD